MSFKALPYLDYPFSYHEFLVRTLSSHPTASLPSLAHLPSFLAQTNHLLPNNPCVFSPRLTSSWSCFSTFLLPSQPNSSPSSSSSSSHRINTSHLLSLQGSSNPVSVHRPSTQLEREEGEASTVCQDRCLEEVFRLWEEGKEEGRGLYVKDWHLALQVERGGGEEFYETPEVFRDDWLDGWHRSMPGTVEDDFRFVVSRPPRLSFISFSLIVGLLRSDASRPPSSHLPLPFPSSFTSTSAPKTQQPTSTETSTPPTPSPPTSSVGRNGRSSLPPTPTFFAASPTYHARSSSRTFATSTSRFSRDGKK